MEWDGVLMVLGGSFLSEVGNAFPFERLDRRRLAELWIQHSPIGNQYAEAGRCIFALLRFNVFRSDTRGSHSLFY
jgi:hypothetical protein